MKTVISLTLLFFATQAIACKLDTQYKFVSLSGPITMLMEELGVVADANLTAISNFHPIKTQTDAAKLAGGLFLSSKVLKSFIHKVVFIDASKELESTFNKAQVKRLEVVSSRTLDAFEVTERNIKQLSPYLVECDQKLDQLRTRIQNLKKKLSNLKNDGRKFIFFLGEIKANQLPPMVIVQDGGVKTLIDHGLQSYPSELAFASWAEKTLRSLEGEVLHLGMAEGETDQLKIQEAGEKQFNLSMRGLLYPGITQLYFVEEFINSSLLIRNANK